MYYINWHLKTSFLYEVSIFQIFNSVISCCKFNFATCIYIKLFFKNNFLFFSASDSVTVCACQWSSHCIGLAKMPSHLILSFYLYSAVETFQRTLRGKEMSVYKSIFFRIIAELWSSIQMTRVYSLLSFIIFILKNE